VRIWDLPAGYLNRQSLLGEHRELHGIYNILTAGKKGYSRHPETLRWSGAIGGLVCRHQLLVSEMQLRGYLDRTPLKPPHVGITWPITFVTNPLDQVALLRKKYVGQDKGRIPLPKNAQELWAHHKYSVMARSVQTYQRIGRIVARQTSRGAMEDLINELVAILRERPETKGLTNAVEHMWGYVRQSASADEVVCARRSVSGMLVQTQIVTMRTREKYLMHSTALSELAVDFAAASPGWSGATRKSKALVRSRMPVI
jgi:hypothetical protein